MREEAKFTIDETQKDRPRAGLLATRDPTWTHPIRVGSPVSRWKKSRTDRPAASQVKPEDYPDKASGKDL